MAIIHRHLLSTTAEMPSSLLRHGQLFGESNVEPRNHSERKVPSSSSSVLSNTMIVTSPVLSENKPSTKMASNSYQYQEVGGQPEMILMCDETALEIPDLGTRTPAPFRAALDIQDTLAPFRTAQLQFPDNTGCNEIYKRTNYAMRKKQLCNDSTKW
eukprot:CAMPEP_0201998344 /NCGR_PEP_ID=MMETSP0905-20130828/5151_1 /ASSEMBLY_ACC=CAM_ASM_000554 /TAXON_ID=420261 /ORGANISM="Thalassiosira antarctica, Strain CCMP982" /LENGTH=156 /DNA_ID=CAMNT_0048554291 /DNA_START=104 /DNA_END=571 /DNA_ORIENTATION=-